jgi:serralysin
MATNAPMFACLTKHPTTHQIMKSVMNAPAGAKLSVQKARAAFLKGKQWEQGQTIRIAFLQNSVNYQNQILNPQYTREKADYVRQVIMSDVAPLVNLKFEWNADPATSDVRIMFVPDLGAWSYIGTDNAGITKDQPTMNLGWIDNDTNFDAPQYRGTGIVVIHEFGHMLGMIHEHSRADAKLDWNKPVIYKALGGPPNNWSQQQVDQQVFETYSVDSFNGSAYDPSSVMHYIFPPEWFLTNPHLPTVTHLSPLDKEWISKTYGGGSGGSSGDGSTPGLKADGSCADGSKCYGAYCDDGTFCGKEGFMGMNLSNDSGMCTWKKVGILALSLVLLYYLLKKTKSRK